MPRDSANGTLNIEEHSYAEDFDQNNNLQGDTFEDGNFKNRIV